MEFKITNTQSGQKERVFPSDNDSLRFYCCGPTVYGPAHIGNFRTFCVQDVFRRTTEAFGIKTTHVRNITDFDDKTIRRSQEVNQSLIEFTEFWKNKFHNDCEQLNCLSPHVEPSALAHIPEQIELIKGLERKGYAYQADDKSVYFRISAYEDYGKLSGLRKENRRENADGRLNANDEYGKEDFADFALWKTWKPEDGPNKWDSPWGPGRPGWHVECSAMSMKYLGESYDMHSGGVDLVFPHHENEIAQSECCTGKSFVRHWFHVTHLMVDGAKMSKSLGNLYTLEDINKKGYTAEELRYVLISGHYRQPLNFTLGSLNAAKSALSKLRKFDQLLNNQKEANDAKKPSQASEFGAFQAAFEALADDLNIAKALGVIFSTVSKLEKDPTLVDNASISAFEKLKYALGLNLIEETPDTATLCDAPESVKALAEQRWQAKQDKNWADADRLRDEITAAGWTVKDAKDGFELIQNQ